MSCFHLRTRHTSTYHEVIFSSGSRIGLAYAFGDDLGSLAPSLELRTSRSLFLYCRACNVFFMLASALLSPFAHFSLIQFLGSQLVPCIRVWTGNRCIDPVLATPPTRTTIDRKPATDVLPQHLLSAHAPFTARCNNTFRRLNGDI